MWAPKIDRSFEKDALCGCKILQDNLIWHQYELAYKTSCELLIVKQFYLAGFPSYGKVQVKNRLLDTPLSHLTPSLGISCECIGEFYIPWN